MQENTALYLETAATVKCGQWYKTTNRNSACKYAIKM